MATKKPAAKAVDRKQDILTAGAKLASKYGVKNVTRRMVAAAAKVSEALVSSYMGDTAKAQGAYKRHATKLGLTLPTAAEAEVLGAKLRAHGPRKAPVVRRKRSDKEIAAIQRKTAKPIGKVTKVTRTKGGIAVEAKLTAEGAALVKKIKAGAAKKSAAVAPRAAKSVSGAKSATSATAASTKSKPAISSKRQSKARTLPVPMITPVAEALPLPVTAARAPKLPPPGVSQEALPLPPAALPLPL